MSTKIICGFPGSGKTKYYKDWSQYSPENVWRRYNNGEQVYNNLGFPCGEKIIDLDYRDYMWIKSDDKTEKSLNPDFPSNYINKIKEYMETEGIIFISTHNEVRKALENEGIPYTIILPTKDMKEMYTWRYEYYKENKDNDPNYKEVLEYINENWDELITELENDNYGSHVYLSSKYINYEYITNSVIDDIIPSYEVEE